VAADLGRASDDTQGDLKTWVTLMDAFDANEALDLKGAMAEKAQTKSN
jgi:hypothetical protein